MLNLGAKAILPLFAPLGDGRAMTADLIIARLTLAPHTEGG